MAGEDVVHLRVHLVLLLEEAPRRVRDRREVVGDLVDHDGLDADRDALRRHAVDVELGLVEVEREPADGLEAGDDEDALPDDDLEAEALRPPTSPCGPAWARRPEMIIASLGSAMRYIPFTRSVMIATAATAAMATRMSNDMGGSFLSRETADIDSPGGLVVDHDDALADGDPLAGDGGVGVERLRAAAHGDHHLTDRVGSDRARDATGLADDPVICHLPSLQGVLPRGKSA